MEIRVILNGTAVNRWLQFSLVQNPFPQIAKRDLLGAMDQISSLDSEPLTGPADIRKRLEGFSEEFIKLCIDRFKVGQLVEFRVIYDENKE